MFYIKMLGKLFSKSHRTESPSHHCNVRESTTKHPENQKCFRSWLFFKFQNSCIYAMRNSRVGIAEIHSSFKYTLIHTLETKANALVL